MGIVLRVAVWTAAAVVFVGVGWWAGHQVATPHAEVDSDRGTSWYEVGVGTVSDSAPLVVGAQWHERTRVVSSLAGTLTEQVAPDGAVVHDGDIVGTVDLSPIVLASGTIPAFRDLRPGLEGKDVAQLQAFLAREDLYDGPLDGSWGRATTDAVKQWQRTLGLEPDGQVPRGTLLFVADLPAPIVWQARVGDNISTGSEILSLLDKEPAFSVQLRRAVLAGLPPQSTVVIEAPDGTAWTASLGAVRDLGADEVEVLLVSGQSICGDGCGLIPLADSTRLVANVILVPATTGSLVPVSAIQVSADGSTSVVVENRGIVEVSILASADGLVVLEGVEAGDRVAIPSLDSRPSDRTEGGAD